MPDIEIPCVQCKEIFLFTEKEQEMFYQRNMMPPQRCAKCRSKKAVTSEEGPKRFDIVCDNCGSTTRYHFIPKSAGPCSAVSVTPPASRVCTGPELPRVTISPSMNGPVYHRTRGPECTTVPAYQSARLASVACERYRLEPSIQADLYRSRSTGYSLLSALMK